MDAGVPIKAPVSGIAMGLVKEGDDYVILTDIQGAEDHLGDMDFKVAGTADGITALQMDIKITGVSREIMENALSQAKRARAAILERMLQAIPEPRAQLAETAPRISTVQINPEYIGMVIGKGGETIRSLESEYEVQIDIEEDGTILIYATSATQADAAISAVTALTKEPEVGDQYTGKVVKTTDFGAFVELKKGTDGLLHVSNVGPGRVNHIEDVIARGDVLDVVVQEVDKARGRIGLKLVQKHENGGPVRRRSSSSGRRTRHPASPARSGRAATAIAAAVGAAGAEALAARARAPRAEAPADAALQRGGFGRPSCVRQPRRPRSGGSDGCDRRALHLEHPDRPVSALDARASFGAVEPRPAQIDRLPVDVGAGAADAVARCGDPPGAHLPVNLLRRTAPVDLGELGLEEARVARALLALHVPGIAGLDPLERPRQRRGDEREQRVEHLARTLEARERRGALREHCAGVEVGVHAVEGVAELRVAVAKRPADRVRPAVPRQQRGMAVDDPVARHRERVLGDPEREGRRDRELRLERLQQLREPRRRARNEHVEVRRPRVDERRETLVAVSPGRPLRRHHADALVAELPEKRVHPHDHVRDAREKRHPHGRVLLDAGAVRPGPLPAHAGCADGCSNGTTPCHPDSSTATSDGGVMSVASPKPRRRRSP